MRLLSVRRLTIAALCLLAAGLVAAGALAAQGGLSVNPGILEQVARPGSVGALKISNTTSHPMKVRLAVRPWIQAPQRHRGPQPPQGARQAAPQSQELLAARGRDQSTRPLSRPPCPRAVRSTARSK